MATILSLVNQVMPELIGAPMPLVQQRYVDAAREFFFETRAWRLDDTINTVDPAFKRYYGFNIAALEAEMFDVISVEYKNEQLDRVTTQQLARRTNDTHTGIDYYTPLPQFGVFDVYTPTEAINSDLTGTFILRPLRTATTLPDYESATYGEVIEHGVLARMMAMSKKAWTDLPLAAYHAQKFQDGIDKWTSRAADGGVKSVPRSVAYGGL